MSNLYRLRHFLFQFFISTYIHFSIIASSPLNYITRFKINCLISLLEYFIFVEKVSDDERNRQIYTFACSAGKNHNKWCLSNSTTYCIYRYHSLSHQFQQKTTFDCMFAATARKKRTHFEVFSVLVFNHFQREKITAYLL